MIPVTSPNEPSIAHGDRVMTRICSRTISGWAVHSAITLACMEL